MLRKTNRRWSWVTSHLQFSWKWVFYCYLPIKKYSTDIRASAVLQQALGLKTIVKVPCKQRKGWTKSTVFLPSWEVGILEIRGFSSSPPKYFLAWRTNWLTSFVRCKQNAVQFCQHFEPFFIDTGERHQFFEFAFPFAQCFGWLIRWSVLIFPFQTRIGNHLNNIVGF